jgi:transcriptional regulator with XRE-family HTH domain
MKVSRVGLARLCGQRRITGSELLGRAGVSRNAFYTLLRKREMLPRSLVAIAQALNVAPSALLEENRSPAQDMRRLLAAVDKVMRRHPEADRDNVRHTLILLQEQPVDRLRRALTRARQTDLRR